MKSKNDEKTMRLNRFLARSGVCSRRKADTLIELGRIMVNGVMCKELGTVISPETDVVMLDGKRITLPDHHYYKCYKPRWVVTTMSDPEDRYSIADLMKSANIREGVVPAGRLDRDSEGLLILSNDGDLLQKLSHPKHEVHKIYRVLIERWPMEQDIEKLRTGVKCAAYTASALRVTRMGPQPRDFEHPSQGYWIEMVLGEGKKREIREMMAALRYKVIRLVRISHGPITCGTLKPGEICPLSEEEVEALKNL